MIQFLQAVSLWWKTDGGQHSLVQSVLWCSSQPLCAHCPTSLCRSTSHFEGYTLALLQPATAERTVQGWLSVAIISVIKVSICFDLGSEFCHFSWASNISYSRLKWVCISREVVTLQVIPPFVVSFSSPVSDPILTNWLQILHVAFSGVGSVKYCHKGLDFCPAICNY